MNTANNTSKRSKLVSLCLLALPVAAMAQENAPAQVSYFSNALFNTLLVVIILLAILIVALSSVAKNITNSEMFAQKLKKRAERLAGGSGKAAMLFILFSLMGMQAFAADGTAGPVAVSDRIGGVDQFTFYVMISVILMEVVFVVVMLQTMQQFLKADVDPQVVTSGKPKEKTILDRLSDAVDVEREETILMDHDYDGIKELDNNLPPWWVSGFYATIAFAFVYLVVYHITGSAPLQGEEYKISVRQAEAQIAEYMKNSANNVDESTVKMLTSAEDIKAGQEIFQSICKTCHGNNGEGNKIGPNLTDDYWLHGGSIKDIFKTIKYGWPDKGMQSWKEQYSPMQMAQLTSYIKSLKGTNPANAKEPQGELYVEQGAAPADSTAAAVADSLKVTAPSDTAKKTK